MVVVIVMKQWFIFLFKGFPRGWYRQKLERFKAGAHLRKVLSKIPREAVSSAVSSRVRWSFREFFFASRGREKKYLSCLIFFAS